MISVTSTTDRYIIQPALLNKHQETLGWLSAAILWKRELAFFQKLLDKNANKFSAADDKKKIDHFQSLITYYRGELVDVLSGKLRLHERKLAEMLEDRNEAKVEYFKEHDDLMAELASFNKQFTEYKEEFFNFIEKVI